MHKVRTAMEYLAATAGGNLMFLAHKSFWYDHKNLFLGNDTALLSLSERGQLADKTILQDGLQQVEYGLDGYVGEFYPKISHVEQKQLMLSPSINFGRLCIARLGVGAHAIRARFKAGEKMADIAEDFGATTLEVEEAIRWHEQIAA